MIAIGNTELSNMYLGSTAVQKAYLGSSLVWGGESYPETMWPGIRPLAYISNTDTSTMGTMTLKENIFSSDCSIVVDVQIPNPVTSKSYYILGSQSSIFSLRYLTKNKNYSASFRGDGDTGNKYVYPSGDVAGKRVRLTITWGSLTVKNLEDNSSETTATVARKPAIPSTDLVFFRGVTSADGTLIKSTEAGAQIYSVEIYKNGNLISSIIPVIDTNNGNTICFMDRLDNIWSGSRFVNSTDGTFGKRNMSQYKYLISNLADTSTLMDINDGIVHYQYGNPDFKIQCGLFIPTAAQGDSKWGNIYGLRQDTAAYSGPGFNVEKHNVTNTIRLHYDMPDLFNQTLYPPAGAVDNIFGVDLEVEHTYKYFRVGSYRADNPNTIPQTADTYDSFAIFGTIAANTKSPIRESGYKIVDFFKIWNGNQLVRNLVPFYDGNTNGLVDLYTLSRFYATQFKGAVGANTWVKDL